MCLRSSLLRSFWGREQRGEHPAGCSAQSICEGVGRWTICVRGINLTSARRGVVPRVSIGRQFGEHRGEGRCRQILAWAVADYLIGAGELGELGDRAYHSVAPRAANNALPPNSASPEAVGCSVSNACVRAASVATFFPKRSSSVPPEAPRPNTGYVNASMAALNLSAGWDIKGTVGYCADDIVCCDVRCRHVRGGPLLQSVRDATAGCSGWTNTNPHIE
jgi:hypothetical protein